MSFFEELKRRNVVRVGIAYVVGSWLLLQLTEVLSELLNLPEAVGPVVVSAVAIGFPIVLFCAWAFELTPEGVKREEDVDRSRSITPQTGKKLNVAIFVMMSIATAYLLYDKFTGGQPQAVTSADPKTAQITGAPENVPPTVAPAVESRPSIAVLPFDNRSRLEDDEFFVEGIHDDLLTNLARIGSLKVISRTSVGKYRDTEKTIPEIATELDVSTIMEGAVQRAGNTVRINVQLIDARTDEHLWADIFDREMTAKNLFAIQTEIATAIADALETTLTADEQKRISDRPTQNLEAYNAFLRGRQLLVGRKSTELDQALVEFRNAVELDPDFALAWVGISDAAALANAYGTLDPLESLNIREQAAQRAMAINPALGEAHLAVASLQADRDQDAEASYLKAIELNPNYATAYQWYGNYLSFSPPRLREALELLRKAAELDPLSSVIQSSIAARLRDLGRFEEARKQFEHVLIGNPDFGPAFSGMASVFRAQGRLDEQVVWLKRALANDPDNIGLISNLQWAYMGLDDVDAIRGMLVEKQDSEGDHFVLAFSDMVLSMWDGKPAAALEQARWIYQQTGNAPFMMRIMGYLNSQIPNHEGALEAFAISDPEFFIPEQWDNMTTQSPETSCLLAWNLLQAGDKELGSALLQHQIKYFENELPNYLQHADRTQVEYCYAAQGNWDKAINAIERRFAHKHYLGWYFLERHMVFEPLWNDPRFLTVMNELKKDLALQRENLARMEAQGQL